MIKALNRQAAQLAGEAETNHKERQSLLTQLGMLKARIHALESGESTPLNLFLAVRLWDPNHETLCSRAEMVRHGFAAMGSATCHLATNPATAMQLWFQTWPGWTCSPYRGFDLPADDAAVADLLPWTTGFHGRLEGAEALYESPRGSLVGVSTQVNGVPQPFLVFGQIGVGKSLLLTDLLAQTGHLYDFLLIVEENLSHGTTVQALGAEPMVISPHGNATINYLDPGQAPWGADRQGQAVGTLAQMAGETGRNADPSRAARVRGCLSAHLEAFYNDAWQEWARAHFEEARAVARRACALERYRQTAMDPDDVRSQIGRTSVEPKATFGIREAWSSAVSRSGQSSR
jgi:type IV secretion system protein TrbE